MLTVWFILGLRAVLDRARVPGRPRVADGGGIERVDPGHDDRDGQLLRRDLRGRSTIRPGPSRTMATFIPPSAPFVVPLRAAFDAICPWRSSVAIAITVAGDLGPLLDRRAGLRRGRAPDRRPDQAPRRVALGRASRLRSGRRAARRVPGSAAGVPEDDRLAVPRAGADAGDEAGQRLGRVDRVDQDRPRSGRAGRRPPSPLGRPP